MNKALKEFVVPAIKQLGFTGSFPHFRKKEGNNFQFLSFQFRSTGGSYVVEVAKIREEDISPFLEHQKFEKLNYIISNERFRLGAISKEEDHWFSFEDFNNQSQFNQLAKKTVSYLPQGIEFLK